MVLKAWDPVNNRWIPVLVDPDGILRTKPEGVYLAALPTLDDGEQHRLILTIDGKLLVDDPTTQALVQDIIDELADADYGLAALEAYVSEIPDIEGKLDVPPLDMVLALLLDEGTGTTAYDASLQGNDGTIDGATWVDSERGKALSFDGEDDLLSVADDASIRLGTADFTIAIRFKSVTAPTDVYPSMMGKGDSEAGEWMLRLDAADKVSFYANAGSWFTSAAAYADGEWHQAVVVRDGDNAYLYVDGDYEGIKTGVDAMDLNTVKALQIGCADSSAMRYWDGSLKEGRIYTRALSATEIAELWESTRREIEELTHPQYGLPALDVILEHLLHHVDHVSAIFPEDTNETVTVTAGAGADTFGAWAELVDNNAVTLSSKFAADPGHITSLIVEECSRTDERYLLEISYGAAKTMICRSRFMKQLAMLDVGHQMRIRSIIIPAGETIYYRLKCETANATAEMHVRYYLV